MGTFSLTYQDGKLLLFSSYSIFTYFLYFFLYHLLFWSSRHNFTSQTGEGQFKSSSALEGSPPTLLQRKQYGRPCYSRNMQLVQFSASGCPKMRGLIVQHAQHLLQNLRNPAKRILNSGLKYPHRAHNRKQADILTPLNITDMPVVM